MSHRFLDPGLDHGHASIPSLRSDHGLILALDEVEAGDEHDADDNGNTNRHHQDAALTRATRRKLSDHVSFLFRMTTFALWPCSVLVRLPNIFREQPQVIVTTLQLVSWVTGTRT